MITNPVQFLDCYVTVVYTDGSEQKTMEGLVTKANPTAILLKVKTKGVQLLDAMEIESITIVEPPRVNPRIRVRTLDLVDEGMIVQHLADRHGWRVDDIPVDLATAVMRHEGIDHSNLSHRHQFRGARSRLDVVERAMRVDQTDDACLHSGVECGVTCNCDCNDCV